MARIKNEVRNWENGGIPSKYMRLFYSLTDSPAFIHLSNGAKWQYIIIRSQFVNNKARQLDKAGREFVICPYHTMREHGISSHSSISDYNNELEKFGFLDIDGGGFRRPNTYTFSAKWGKISREEAEAIAQEIKEAKNRKRSQCKV